MKKVFLTFVFTCFAFLAQAQTTEITQKEILFSDDATGHQYKIFKKSTFWGNSPIEDYLVVQQKGIATRSGKILMVDYPARIIKRSFNVRCTDCRIEIISFNITWNKKLAVFYRINDRLDKVDVYEWNNGIFIPLQESPNPSGCWPKINN